jgi:hypothetical protein
MPPLVATAVKRGTKSTGSTALGLTGPASGWTAGATFQQSPEAGGHEKHLPS